MLLCSSSSSGMEAELSPESVIEEHMKSVKFIINLVNETVKRQDVIIPVILTANERFNMARVSNPSSMERDRVVRPIHVISTDTWFFS